MITKADALKRPSEMWHVSLKNRDGTPVRCRSNGACKTWTTRPEDFRLPVKIGLRGYDAITHEDAYLWCLPERWEIERHWRL